MLKISLKLTRGEMYVLYIYSNQAFTAWSDPSNRMYMLSLAIQLAEHYERTRKQVITWHKKPPNKEFRYSLPISLAIAYHHWLQKRTINLPERNTLLAKIDKALIDCHIKPQTVESHD